jgi:hypothetical protein
MLYVVEVRSLNQAVARNRKRFPADFAFQLTDDELAALRSQIVTSNTGRGGRRYLPYAFTEQGVAMLSSVLRSARAVESLITSSASPLPLPPSLNSVKGAWLPRSFTLLSFHQTRHRTSPSDWRTSNL